MKLMPVFIVLLLSVSLFGQAQNDAEFSMTVNGVTGTGPIAANVLLPGNINLELTGNPDKPFLIVYGLSISVGAQIIGPVSLDLGGADVLVDGVSPASFFDFLANTGTTGTTNFNFPVGTHLSPGFYAGVQAVVVDFTLPLNVADTAATGITLLAPIDYGTINYGKGVGTSNTNAFTTTFNTPLIDQPVPSSDYDMQAIVLNYYSEYNSQTLQPGQVNYLEDPAIAGALSQSRGVGFESISTIHGQLYSFRDNTVPGFEWGYLLDSGLGGTLVEIPGSRMTNGTSTGSPFESEMTISPDQNTAAFVFDPAGTGNNDQVFLMKLDGTTFPSTGTGVMDVTPIGANATIPEESLKFVGDAFYFVDGTSGGNFFRCAADGSTGIATVVTLPNTGTGLPAITTDGESFYHAPSDSLFIQAGNSATNEDIYQILAATSTTELILNITNHPLATELEEFGDGYYSSNGHISVSPLGTQVAYCQRIAADDEVFVIDTTGVGTPTHVTSNANFDVLIDDAIDYNFYDNDNVMFWAGTTSSVCDLYNYNVTTGQIINITATNTQDGTLLPITAVPAPTIDPDGQFYMSDRMIFARDGILSFGPSAGTSALNICGVEYATLNVYNVTGDEWPGATTLNGNESSQQGHEITFARGSSLAYFKSSVILPGLTSSDEEIWSVDFAAGTPAVPHGLVAPMTLVDNITPIDGGIEALIAYSPGDFVDNVHRIFALAPGSTQISNETAASTDIADGTLRYFGTSAGSMGCVYAAGTNSQSSPTDAFLKVADFNTLLDQTIDNFQGLYWIFNVQ